MSKYNTKRTEVIKASSDALTEYYKSDFLEKIERIPFSGCWVWMGAMLQTTGYGVVIRNKKPVRTHRYAWMLLRGQIPDGLGVLHKCDIKLCVNPDHLYLGTHSDNLRDLIDRGGFTPMKGEKNGHAKLAEKDVLDIRSRIGLGEHMPSLAKEYGVSFSNICNIKARRTWRHL